MAESSLAARAWECQRPRDADSRHRTLALEGTRRICMRTVHRQIAHMGLLSRSHRVARQERCADTSGVSEENHKPQSSPHGNRTCIELYRHNALQPFLRRIHDPAAYWQFRIGLYVRQCRGWPLLVHRVHASLVRGARIKIAGL